MSQHPVAPVARDGSVAVPATRGAAAGPGPSVRGSGGAAARAPCGAVPAPLPAPVPALSVSAGVPGVPVPRGCPPRAGPARRAPWLVRRFPRGFVALPMLVRGGMGKEG